MLRDLVSHIKLASTLLPANRTADANGVSVDCQGYHSAMAVAHIGAPGDTLSGSLKIEMELQHSDDGTTFAACADADLSAPVVGTNTGTFAVIDAGGKASQAYKVGYKGTKRYLRVVHNITGTHSVGTPTSALVELASAAQQPVA